MRADVLHDGASRDPAPDSILPLRLEQAGYSAGTRTLLSGIDLEIRAGGTTVVLGFNGAGKSLLLRLCHGLLAPTTGKVRWSGADRRTAAMRQAMVFQRPLMLRRTVLGNVEYPLSLRGIAATARRSRAQQALAAAGLESLAGRYAPLLSGGEQQRAALARARVTDPQVLFLDEPTANLDPGATRAVEEIVQSFRAGGVKVVMTTHDVAQARRLADDVVFLHGGRVLEHRPAGEFFSAPASAEARAFVRGELP